MIRGRDQARGQRRGGRAQADVQRPGFTARCQGVQQPQLTEALVDHPAAVRGGLAGVPAVMVGVPEQVGPVQQARVDIAGALVVGQERQPVTDQHGTGELAGQAGQDALERGAAHRGPQPPRGAAAVALPEGRVTSPGAVQQSPRALRQGHVRDRPERQPLGRTPLQRDGVRPALPLEGLAARAQGHHLATGRPAAHPGELITPVGEAASPLAVHPGQVHLGRAIPPARPRHPAPVGGKMRAGGLRPVGGQPPRPAAVQRGQPHIILGHEREQVTLNMRKAKVSG